MVDKKAVIIATLVTLVIVGLVMYIGLNKDNTDKQNIVNNNISNINKDLSEENLENNELTVNEENVESKKENKTEENNIENENKNENKNTSADTKKQEKLTGEDLAISLAKKKWGKKNDSVYFNVEDKISDNTYIVSVRDSNTIELVEYKVNVNTNKVEEN